MKYPSVFLAIFFIWVSIIIVSVILKNSAFTFNLYLSAVILSLTIFVIGFWRNK